MFLESELFIGIPTCDIKEYCLKQFIENIRQQPCNVHIVDNSLSADYFSKIGQVIDGVSVCQCNIYYDYIGSQFDKKATSRERLAVTRNYLRDIFLKSTCQWYLSLESDMLPTEKQIQKLYDDHTDGVIGALMQRAGSDTVASKRIDYKPGKVAQRYNYGFGELKGKITKVNGIHMGMTLIPRVIMERFKFRFEPAVMQHDDTFWSLDLSKHNVLMYCDGFVTPEHLFRDWPKGLKI